MTEAKRSWLVACAPGALAACVAAPIAAHLLAFPDPLWHDVYHDRHSHLTFGLDLALAVSTADPLWFLHELAAARVWGPLHGVVLAAVFLAGGTDERLAVVPSLAGWVITVAFVALVAHRLFVDRVAGGLAAAIAVTLTIGSPVQRLLASDVMLESLGAGLSAVAVWAYGVARSGPDREPRWRALAVVLTLLFFHKANYWGLVAAALALAYLSEEPRRWLDRLRRTAAGCDIRASFRAASRDPLLLTSALLLAIVLGLYARGPTVVELLGRRVSLHPPENLTTAAWAVLALRGCLHLRRHRGAVEAALGPAGRALATWHAVPVAVSFVFPKRLSAFLWFVGPANSPHAWDAPGALALYWSAFTDGFHPAPWLAAATLASALVAAIGLPRPWPPGARAVFALILVSGLGVAAHPQHQARFLASWVFALWIAAGAGVAIAWERLLAGSPVVVRVATALGLAALLAVAVAGTTRSPLALAHALRTTSGPDDRDLVRPILPDLAGARRVMVATTFGSSRLFHWVVRQHTRRRTVVEDPWVNHASSREDARRQMASAVTASSADVIVVVDAPGSRFALPSLGWTYDRMAGIVDAMEEQRRYVRAASHRLPGNGGTATVWRRVYG